MISNIIEEKTFGNVSIAMRSGFDKPYAVSYTKDGICTSWLEFSNGEDAYEDFWARVDFEEIQNH